MNRNAVIFSILFSSILLLLLITAIISLYYFGDENLFKDGLSIISGIFGGLATLVAAIIACYLYNDWKEQPKLVIALEMYDTTREINENFEALRSLNPTLKQEVGYKEFYELRNIITNKINHLLYLERKYKALINSREFKVFKNHSDQNLHSVKYLNFLIGGTSSYFTYLLNCREGTEEMDKIDYYIAFKLFDPSFDFFEIKLSSDENPTPIDDIGNKINVEIENIYSDIEQITKK